MDNVLDQVLEYLEYGHRYENYVSGLCPFHEDSRPSFIVHEDTYYCLSCGAKGRTDYLLSIITSSPSKISIHLPFSNPWTKWLKKQSLKHLLYNSQQQIRECPSVYLRNRGIDNETQMELKLGIRENWLLFPIYDDADNVVGAVARDGEGGTSSAKYVCPSRQDPNMIYVPSWDNVKINNYVICTFGIIDAVSLYVLGIPAFSTTNGKRINPDALDWCRKPIIFFPDKGEEEDARRIANQLGWRGHVIECDYPDDAKDPNDLLINHKDMLKELLYVNSIRFRK